MWRMDVQDYNVFYALRLFYFVISQPAVTPDILQFFTFYSYSSIIVVYLLLQRNRSRFFRQLIILEIIYKIAKYTVDDTRKVIWPFILANEIFDQLQVSWFLTTECLPFELQLVKILQTFEHFVLLNQYPDFSILIWLLVIVSLQLFTFYLYFRDPPLTWTVPIFDIEPLFVPRNPYMIYTRYVAIGLVLAIFGSYWEHLSPKL
ncbi:hypothetical protein L3Y34_009683 [Caenorhabditis briggsae]|uniref:Uncharacterized protein n=1 Tax=Caenorhabditis briggsae TaxID=6238 RepID=A0AAE9A5Y4_CAEBR|nr:hypothetical protein L3Y34_009683 [Caenorhabditis briggsae]